jgi:DNA-binding MarR family transcriptional regulator
LALGGLARQGNRRDDERQDNFICKYLRRQAIIAAMARRARPSGDADPDVMDVDSFLGVKPDARDGEPVCQVDGTCSGATTSPIDLAGLDEAERLRVLAALTARFSSSYQRWMRSRAGEVLTYPRARVLEVLASEGPAIMRDIAGRLSMTARNMTAIVDALEDAGMVQRVAHPHDRRATLITLTKDGRREAHQVRAQAASRVGVAFNTLSLEDQQQYAELLTRLAATFCE